VCVCVAFKGAFTPMSFGLESLTFLFDRDYRLMTGVKFSAKRWSIGDKNRLFQE